MLRWRLQAHIPEVNSQYHLLHVSYITPAGTGHTLADSIRVVIYFKQEPTMVVNLNGLVALIRTDDKYSQS